MMTYKLRLLKACCNGRVGRAVEMWQSRVLMCLDVFVAPVL